MSMNALYILCGIPFSGKSTLAKRLVKRLGFKRVDLDKIKIKLLGGDIRDESITQESWDKVYDHMYKEIEDYLRQGENVVQDAGNYTIYERSLVKEIADRLGIETITIFVDVDEIIARERWLKNKKTLKRFDVSKQLFNEAIVEMQPPPKDEHTLVYDGESDIQVWIDEHLITEE